MRNRQWKDKAFKIFWGFHFPVTSSPWFFHCFHHTPHSGFLSVKSHPLDSRASPSSSIPTLWSVITMPRSRSGENDRDKRGWWAPQFRWCTAQLRWRCTVCKMEDSRRKYKLFCVVNCPGSRTHFGIFCCPMQECLLMWSFTFEMAVFSVICKSGLHCLFSGPFLSIISGKRKKIETGRS